MRRAGRPLSVIVSLRIWPSSRPRSISATSGAVKSGSGGCRSRKRTMKCSPTATTARVARQRLVDGTWSRFASARHCVAASFAAASSVRRSDSDREVAVERATRDPGRGRDFRHADSLSAGEHTGRGDEGLAPPRPPSACGHRGLTETGVSRNHDAVDTCERSWSSRVKVGDAAGMFSEPRPRGEIRWVASGASLPEAAPYSS